MPAAGKRAEAKKLGLAVYFTGVACPQGHVAERQTSNGGCIDCRRESNRGRLGRSSPDYNRKYYAENREKVRAGQAKRYAANPDSAIARALAWQQAHPEKARGKLARWKAINPTALKSWRQANPSAVAAHQATRRARHVGAEGTFSASDIIDLLDRQAGKCFWCDIPMDGRHTVDHLHPLSRGGSNWPSNLALSCQPCNSRKGALSPEEFKQKMRGV